MSAPREKPAISDWTLERLAAGDLDASATAALRERLASDDEARARLQALERSNQELLSAHPPLGVADEVRRRLRQRAAAERQPSSRRWFLLAAPLGAAAVALVLVARPQPITSDPTGDLEVTRPRGKAEVQPRLRVYRKAGDQAQRLNEGTPVRAHDTLQVGYLSARRAFGAVLSVDGRGVVTWHLPEQAGAAVRLAPRDEVLLPHAFELDAAPGFERFVFITADHPFDATAMARALGAGQALPAGYEQTAFTLKKETP